LTANQLEENRDKSRLAGMEDFLGKPVKADVLASALTRWIARDEA
jgi:CheY-like chemotaxis protein